MENRIEKHNILINLLEVVWVWCLGLSVGCLELSDRCLDLSDGCLDSTVWCLDLVFGGLDLSLGVWTYLLGVFRCSGGRYRVVSGQLLTRKKQDCSCRQPPAGVCCFPDIWKPKPKTLGSPHHRLRLSVFLLSETSIFLDYVCDA